MRSGLELTIVALTAASVLSCGPGKPKGAVQATTECDHLEPRPSPVTDPNYLSTPDYEVAVASTLFSRVPSGEAGNEELLMVMVNDSVPEPQEAVYILASRPGTTPVGQYRVVHARARNRVAQGGPSAEADLSEAFLDQDAVAALERVWTGMTATARWRTRDEILPTKFTIHGPSRQFAFDYWGSHVFSQGMTSSREDGSCSAALVSIGEVLARFADEPDERGRHALRERLVSEIGRLSERIGIANDGRCGGSPCRAAALGRESSVAKR
jgi:hypothetical protein